MEREMTFGDLVREAREIGRRGDREEIDRFTAKSHIHSMIMSGRVGASVTDGPEAVSAWTLSEMQASIKTIVFAYLRSCGHIDERKTREIAGIVASDAVRKTEYMRPI